MHSLSDDALHLTNTCVHVKTYVTSMIYQLCTYIHMSSHPKSTQVSPKTPQVHPKSTSPNHPKLLKSVTSEPKLAPSQPQVIPKVTPKSTQISPSTSPVNPKTTSNQERHISIKAIPCRPERLAPALGRRVALHSYMSHILHFIPMRSSYGI